MDKYILVQWPKSQKLMEHERFNECLLVQDIDGSSYMCPEDLYERVFNTSKIKSLRINNLQFRPATYLGDTPPFPSWHIDYFYTNKESSFSVATFNRDNKGYYELSFIDDRPLNLNKSDFNDFMKLVRYGYKELNRLYEEES